MKQHLYVLLTLTTFLVGCSINNEQVLSPVLSDDKKRIKVFTTAKSTQQRLTLTDRLTFKPIPLTTEEEISIVVNPDKRFQNILAFNGKLANINKKTTVNNFKAVQYLYWPNAEINDHSIIDNFNKAIPCSADKNKLLKQSREHINANRFCFSSIHAETPGNELIYTPTYYYIGHFSKFVKPGSTPVNTNSNHSVLLATSFINKENNKISTIVMNKTDNKINYNLIVENKQVIVTIPAKSMQTLVYPFKF